MNCGLFRFLNLAVCIALLLMVGAESRADNVAIHLVRVCATDDPKCFIDIKADSKQIEESFRRHLPDASLKVSDVQGLQLTRKNLFAHLKNLKAEPGGVIVFYYSGHGFYDLQLRQHFLRLTPSEEDVSRAEIRETLLEKRPRLLVLLTDCCAAEALSKPRAFDQIPAGKAPEKVSSLFNSLFVKSRGVIDINSCVIGQVSLTRGDGTGSMFTYRLVRIFEEARDRNLNWSSILLGLEQAAEKDFRELCPEGTTFQVQTGRDETGRVKFETRKQVTVRPWGIEIPRLAFGVRAKAIQGTGLLVKYVAKDSPAAQAGISVDDVILKINDKAILTEADYSTAVDESPRLMKVLVQRAKTGMQETLSVNLAAPVVE